MVHPTDSKNTKTEKESPVFVEWQGFPESFNSWVDADDVKDVSETTAQSEWKDTYT